MCSPTRETCTEVKAPMLIPNPMKGQEATTHANNMQRQITLMLAAMIAGGLVASAAVFFLVELPLVAVVLLVMELGAALILRSVWPKAMSRTNADMVVAGSYLSGITINQFTQPQQLWDAAVTVRDTGDKVRARMILGS